MLDDLLAAFREEVRGFLRAEMTAPHVADHRDRRDLTGWDEAFERGLLTRAGEAGLLGAGRPW
jgi:alkylation response protein AidB-like acyl-CoA dehydrogenase